MKYKSAPGIDRAAVGRTHTETKAPSVATGRAGGERRRRDEPNVFVFYQLRRKKRERREKFHRRALERERERPPGSAFASSSSRGRTFLIRRRTDGRTCRLAFLICINFLRNCGISSPSSSSSLSPFFLFCTLLSLSPQKLCRKKENKALIYSSCVP